MVVICTVFFFIELISGYMIGSLALLADAFHMVYYVHRSPRRQAAALQKELL